MSRSLDIYMVTVKQAGIGGLIAMGGKLGRGLWGATKFVGKSVLPIGGKPLTRAQGLKYLGYGAAGLLGVGAAAGAYQGLQKRKAQRAAQYLQQRANKPVAQAPVAPKPQAQPQPRQQTTMQGTEPLSITSGKQYKTLSNPLAASNPHTATANMIKEYTGQDPYQTARFHQMAMQ
jgi:hypothetical protein